MITSLGYFVSTSITRMGGKPSQNLAHETPPNEKPRFWRGFVSDELYTYRFSMFLSGFGAVAGVMPSMVR